MRALMASFDSLLDYWFGKLTNGFADPAHRAGWFTGRAAFDADLTARFAHLLDSVHTGKLDEWLDSPRGILAYVLTCDQLPRNIFRGSRRAFATDKLALAAARRAVEAGSDQRLEFDERGFLYLPFEHSENLVDQHTCVGLFMSLRDETPSGNRQLTGNSLRFAQRHRDIIRRFGRFPHRNAVLERTSTPDEARFIAQGDGFGQTANAEAK